MDEPEERGIPIEPPLEAVNADEERYERSHEETFDLNLIPSEIWGIIFKHLNGRDLSSAAMVCRNWLKSANSEKWLRGLLCFVEQIEEDIMADEEQFRIDYTRLEQLTFKPSIGFFFLQYTNNNTVKDRICELLPTNCKIIILFTYGLYLNEKKYDNSFHNDVRYSNMMCILLPQIPNVRISMATVTNTISGEHRYTEYIQMIEGSSRENHDSSICLMLFFDYENYKLASEMVTIAKSKLGNNGRLICSSVYSVETNETVPSCVALLIIGPIQTWSIVLEEKVCLTIELIEEKLKLFKEQVKLQKYSMGFMFYAERACMIWQDNIRIKFKELFPKVVLVGYYNLFERDYIAQALFLNKKQHNDYSVTLFILTYNISREDTATQ